MRIAEEKLNKINIGKSYVAKCSSINLIFLIIGIIETILIAIILLDMDIFSMWFILILIVSAISLTYIVFIIFATIISMLDQLTLNNELLIITMDQKDENIAKRKLALKYVEGMNDKILINDASNKKIKK